MELEKILEAGEKHFYGKIYQDVKLDNIANELHIKKPTLYYYFTNKRDFYLEVLRFSLKKYAEELKAVMKKDDLQILLQRYLDYPSKQQNLFAIAAQKGYGNDTEINAIIGMGKTAIATDMDNFLRRYTPSNIRISMTHHLLDKLAGENCLDGYCLDYPIEEFTKEIHHFLICGYT